MKSFSFFSSSELKTPVLVKIGTLVGRLDKLPPSVLFRKPELRFRGSTISLSDLYVTIQLWADSKPLTLPIQTSYKTLFENDRTWDEVLKLPVSYSSLPRASQLAITVWDLLPTKKATSNHRVPFGGTTIPLFDDYGLFHQGRHKCKLHLNREADGLSNSETLYALKKPNDDLNLATSSTAEPPINKTNPQPRLQDPGKEDELSGDMHLYIELAKFTSPLVFVDRQYPPPAPLVKIFKSVTMDGVVARPPAEGYTRLVTVYDPEIEVDNESKDNPVELKHRILVRSNRTGALEVDLRPNAKIRDDLNVIMNYGPTKILTDEQKDLIWKYRYYLTKDKRALIKFANSVSWDNSKTAREAEQLLSKWTEIDIEDAIGLLGPTFKNPSIRAHAVDRLRKADDSELLLYLLQLVQALKFESPDHTDEDHSLSRFLVVRAAQSLSLGTALHWYLLVECDDKSEEQSEENRRLFARVECDFMRELAILPDGAERNEVFLRQGELVTILTRLCKGVRNVKGGQAERVRELVKFLQDPDNGLLRFEKPLPLPLDPSVEVVGCIPDKSNVFKSSMMPIMLTFITKEGNPYPVLFKLGDDLRQDQLVIQVIMLMDRLLQKENLDLKLSPYRILATGASAGMVQFVPSLPVSDIRPTVLDYLRENNPDPSRPLGVDQTAMDTYIKSFAGYSVITYLLGVGDRHLENILVTRDGHFFHADFGFILGRDPKPFAPAVKITDNLVAAMGGVDHPFYQQFKQHCMYAFVALRKSSALILNLFALMTDANIPDIQIEPDKVVFKIRQRLQLDLTEEQAMVFFGRVIDVSLEALFPFFIDLVHEIIQFMRQ